MTSSAYPLRRLSDPDDAPGRVISGIEHSTHFELVRRVTAAIDIALLVNAEPHRDRGYPIEASADGPKSHTRVSSPADQF